MRHPCHTRLWHGHHLFENAKLVLRPKSPLNASGLQTTLRSFGTHEPQFDQTLAALPSLVHNLRRSTDAVQDLADQLDPTLTHYLSYTRPPNDSTR